MEGAGRFAFESFANYQIVNVLGRFANFSLVVLLTYYKTVSDSIAITLLPSSLNFVRVLTVQLVLSYLKLAQVCNKMKHQMRNSHLLLPSISFPIC